VTVSKVVSAKPGELVVSVDVADKAVPGQRDVGVRGSVLVKALSVYDKVDYLKVTPETALAHLGGIKFDKGYEQFEVVGYANGPDGKPRTDDDVPIGPVPVTWSLEECSITKMVEGLGKISIVAGGALSTFLLKTASEMEKLYFAAQRAGPPSAV